LVEFWGSEEIVEQPEIIVGLGQVGISRISRIGKKFLWQIAQAPDSLGYIDSPDVWLHKKEIISRNPFSGPCLTGITWHFP